MVKLGTLEVRLFAQVADGDLIEVGTATVEVAADADGHRAVVGAPRVDTLSIAAELAERAQRGRDW